MIIRTMMMMMKMVMMRLTVWPYVNLERKDLSKFTSIAQHYLYAKHLAFG